MAVYVTSDAHGHVRALDEVLERVSLGAGDELYVLGDLIDRGPDPLGVVSLVRSLPNAHVLLGNHEDLMMLAVARTGAPKDGAFDISGLDYDAFTDWMNWMQNGGATTSEQLERLSAEEYADFLGWVAGLPLYATVTAGGHTFALCHAGISAGADLEWAGVHAGEDLEDPAVLAQMLAAQQRDDLLWIRAEFWGVPTTLVDANGHGPIVVAGHTPSPLLSVLAPNEDVACVNEEGKGTVVELGASAATGGVPDRIDVDCAAASGAGPGRVGVLRLDDLETWFADVREGE